MQSLQYCISPSVGRNCCTGNYCRVFGGCGKKKLVNLSQAIYSYPSSTSIIFSRASLICSRLTNILKPNAQRLNVGRHLHSACVYGRWSARSLSFGFCRRGVTKKVWLPVIALIQGVIPVQYTPTPGGLSGWGPCTSNSSRC